MERGNLIIYDNTGRIIAHLGEAQGDILPHEYPVGIPYIELPYGALPPNLQIVSIDVTTEPHTPITTIVDVAKSQDQLRIEELENKLLEAEGVI